MATAVAKPTNKTVKRASAAVVSDPIADMLTRVRNANAARHTEVKVPASRLKLEIARVLKDEGYIAGYDVEADGTTQTTAFATGAVSQAGNTHWILASAW